MVGGAYSFHIFIGQLLKPEIRGKNIDEIYKNIIKRNS